MSGAMYIDRSQFDAALAEYAVASKKDFADVCNRQMLNLAIHGLRLTKQAEQADIASLESKSWWPKYVAKILVGRGVNKVMKAAAKSRRAGAGAGRRFMARAYTQAQARVASKKLVRKRLRAVRFLKFFFVRLGQAVQPFTKGKRTTGKSFTGFDMAVVPATQQNPRCNVAVGYTYRKRKDKTANRTERLLNNSLRLAFPAVAADMRQYIEKKVAETARKYSAAGVAIGRAAAGVLG